MDERAGTGGRPVAAAYLEGCASLLLAWQAAAEEERSRGKGGDGRADAKPRVAGGEGREGDEADTDIREEGVRSAAGGARGATRTERGRGEGRGNEEHRSGAEGKGSGEKKELGELLTRRLEGAMRSFRECEGRQYRVASAVHGQAQLKVCMCMYGGRARFCCVCFVC